MVSKNDDFMNLLFVAIGKAAAGRKCTSEVDRIESLVNNDSVSDDSLFSENLDFVEEEPSECDDSGAEVVTTSLSAREFYDLCFIKINDWMDQYSVVFDRSLSTGRMKRCSGILQQYDKKQRIRFYLRFGSITLSYYSLFLDEERADEPGFFELKGKEITINDFLEVLADNPDMFFWKEDSYLGPGTYLKGGKKIAGMYLTISCYHDDDHERPLFKVIRHKVENYDDNTPYYTFRIEPRTV